MLKMIKTAVLSALIGLGGIAAIPAAAQADGLYLNFGGGSGVGFHVDDRYGRHDWRHDRRDWRYDRRDWRRGCSPERALNKAERMGLNRARIIDAGPRTVKVAGTGSMIARSLCLPTSAAAPSSTANRRLVCET